jgi:hypothetical protein
MSNPRFSLRASFGVLVSGALLLGASCCAQFSSADADTLMNAYNAAFYATFGSGNAHYKNDQNGGVSYFWTQAEIIEGIEDAYNRSGNVTYQNQISALLNGFSSDNGTDWSWNGYNDDICWACIAYLRGYQATGNTAFRTVAQSNFDMMYARAWDTTVLGGGLWWDTAEGGKNACINGPGSIVAYLLYTTLNDSTYLTKAQTIFNWEKAHLYDSSSGAVWDSISPTGSINYWSSTYNQGTFIGAANYLGDTNNARLAADYLKGSGGLLPDYGTANNNSGFNGIGLRWVAKFMKDRNLQNNYLAWLQFNANYAFINRRSSDNLSWCRLAFPTPSGTFDSWSCIDAVIALQVVPASFPYTWVANEGATVNFDSPVDVAFGINGDNAFQYGVAGNITFNTATFGDPNFGVLKSGYYAAFSQCASENGSYTFTVPVAAAFGAQGNYHYNPGVSGTVVFDVATFGNPISNAAKAGYYMPYTFCAMEGQSNTFTSPTWVAFGANGHYSFKTNVTGTVTFNNATFVDPIPGTAKLGYYRPATIPPALGIANASFETPNVGTGGSRYNPTGGGWTFSGSSGIQANGSVWGAPAAPDGTQTAFLEISNGANNGSMSQTISFGSPGSYTLSFKAALRGPNNNGTIYFNVLVDGKVVGTFLPTTTTSFASFTASFTVTAAGNHTVQFAAVGTPIEATVFIDAIDMSGIANTSFETPNVGTGGYSYNPPGGTWNFIGDSGIQANGSAWGAPTALFGTQTAFLQIRNGADNGSMGQMAFCTAGTHTLSFRAALRSINNGAISFNVVVDGAVVGTYSPTTTSGFTSYATSPFNVVGTGCHFVQFAAVGVPVDASVFIDAVNINPLPSVSLTSPADNAVFSAADSINLAANVSPVGNIINGVGFYANNNLIAQVKAPYAYAWSNAPAGPSAVFARLVFNGTNTLDSLAVNILVTNPPPVAVGIGLSNDGLSLSIQGAGLPNRPYYLNVSSNLVPPVVWTPLLTSQSDASGGILFTNLAPTNARQFFRLSAP